MIYIYGCGQPRINYPRAVLYANLDNVVKLYDNSKMTVLYDKTVSENLSHVIWVFQSFQITSFAPQT